MAVLEDPCRSFVEDLSRLMRGLLWKIHVGCLFFGGPLEVVRFSWALKAIFGSTPVGYLF